MKKTDSFHEVNRMRNGLSMLPRVPYGVSVFSEGKNCTYMAKGSLDPYAKLVNVVKSRSF